MATETRAPDAVLDSLNYTTLTLTDIDEDPDDPDASYGDWDGNGNTSCRVSFGTPTGNPTAGAGLQEFRVLIQRTGTANLGWSLQLWEGGVQVAELATGTLSAASAVVSGTWDASLLGTADGSAVECRLQQTSGGTGGGRQGIEVGAVEWNVTYSADTAVNAGVVNLTLTEHAAAVAYDVNVLAGVDTLTIATFAADVALGINVDAAVVELTLATYAAAVAHDRNVLANTAALGLASFGAVVAYDVNVLAGVTALALATYQATVETEEQGGNSYGTAHRSRGRTWHRVGIRGRRGYLAP